MEIRTLKYFLAVAREQNMTEAANVLFVTQPTLSRQMADLEKELGKKLFVRTNRSTTLTEEGMHLRQRAEEILAWWTRPKKRSGKTTWTFPVASGSVPEKPGPCIGSPTLSGNSIRNIPVSPSNCSPTTRTGSRNGWNTDC